MRIFISFSSTCNLKNDKIEANFEEAIIPTLALSCNVGKNYVYNINNFTASLKYAFGITLYFLINNANLIITLCKNFDCSASILFSGSKKSGILYSFGLIWGFFSRPYLNLFIFMVNTLTVKTVSTSSINLL
jgi:hypothetical protein